MWDGLFTTGHHNQRNDNLLAVISSFNHVQDEKEAPLGDESEPTCK
jgi:hypothetical protein